MMTEMKHRTVETSGIRLHCVEHGTGPLVVMCHRFPESYISGAISSRRSVRLASTLWRPTFAAM